MDKLHTFGGISDRLYVDNLSTGLWIKMNLHVCLC